MKKITTFFLFCLLFVFPSGKIFAQSMNCVTATSLTLTNNSVCVNGTDVGAITDNTLYGGCNTVPVDMVWYTYVTTGSSNQFVVTPGTLTNAEIVIYLGGCPTTGGVLQICNTAVGSSPMTTNWGIPVGTQVWVGVASNAGTDGTFQLCITSTIPPPTGGQFCNTPIILCNENAYTQSSMAQYGSSGQTPSCFANPTQQDMFIEFTVLQTGLFAWTANPANPATEFDWCLWNVTSGCPGTEVCCNYNYGAGSSLGFGQQTQAGTVPCGYNLASGIPSQEFSPPNTLVAGQTYCLQISNYNTNSTGFTLNWTNSTCVIQPNAQFTINPTGPICGASATVSITNTSLGGPQQWNYGDGSPIYTGTNPPSHTYSSPGTYAITCTINGQCPSTFTQFIQVLDPLAASSTSANASCSACNGTASVTNVTGGDGIYTYAWSPGGQTTPSVNGLCAGTYTVTVSNAACASSVQQTVTITSTGSMTASLTASSNVSCNAANNGSATVTPSTGTPPYTYSWNPSAQTTQTATNLGPGTYTCTVTSSDGCTTTVTVTITEPPALTLASTGLSTTCSANCDGQLVVIPTGGTQPYTFLWNTGCATASCTNNCAGNYTVTVTDLNGCTQTSTTTITSPPPITAAMSSTTAHCNNPDGSATVNASGGTGAFTYSWAPSGGNAATANNLTPGTYTVTVTDANNCVITNTVTVANAPGVNITQQAFSNVSCFGACDGSVTISASGGTTPYTYAWLPSGGNAASASNLCNGNYTCTVTDATGCANTYTINITQPVLLTVNTPAAPSICSGQNQQLNANAAGGTTAYSYSWQPGNMNTANPTVTPATTTTYTITVTDANGCTAIDSEMVFVNAVPIAALVADTTQGCAPLCVNFTDLSTVANPSVINAWSWNFGDNGTSTSQNPQHCYALPGVYTVTLQVTGTGGCVGNITMNNYINVSGSPNASFSATPQPTDILDPTVFFTDQSTGAVAWLWEFYDPSNATSILQNPSFAFPDTGCYPVTLIVTNNAGCIDSVTEPVCIDPYWTFYIPNAFTPNADGLNDVFMPKEYGIEEDNYKFWIFDRWGNLIFYTDDLHKGWDGHANGGAEIAQIDTYVWKVQCRDILGGRHKYIGKVSLIK
ncbi:MAG: PKD domain-containing protein [Bacteroidetes bacterium]|nr:PKD domain-containing protein [Bacteroidota bacterium]